MAGPQKQVVEQIPVDEIVVDAGRRDVDSDAVSRLAESIKSIGLKTPITVRLVERADPETGEVETYHVLVVGRHRLEAFRQLGIPYVPSLVVRLDDIDAELWEIAENLHRADLSKDQRDVQIRRYAELLTKKEAEKVGQVGTLSAPTGRGNKGMARKIADQTGLSKRTVARVLKPEVSAVPPRQAPTGKTLDEGVRNRAAQYVVNVIVENLDRELWDGLKANLAVTSVKDILIEFAKVADADTPIMDARHAPSPADGIPDFLRRTA